MAAMNWSYMSLGNKGSLSSRKYSLSTPATEFISRGFTVISGSSPFSNASLNWLISSCEPGIRNMPWLCRPSRLMALMQLVTMGGISCLVALMYSVSLPPKSLGWPMIGDLPIFFFCESCSSLIETGNLVIGN